MKERLQKIISGHGVMSRRAAEACIAAGRVTVNGLTAVLGQSANPVTDRIELDGVPLSAEPEKVYIMLNKPRGYVTTMSDEKGRKNVTELVRDCPVRVYPVGRLDINSEGLLFMTNDGALTQRLTHPSFEKEKTYHVAVRGDSRDAREKLSEPMEIDGTPIRPARVEMLRHTPDGAVFAITIHEGRNRQIRKMCTQAGLEVVSLRRVEEDGIRLDRLKTGAWRYLTTEELQKLKEFLQD